MKWITQPLDPQSPRIVSLDAARGVAMAAMILVNFPGSSKTIWWPLRHAAWNSWTFADVIFPMFLFIAGASMAFSASRATSGINKRRQAMRLLRLYAAGFLLTSLAAGAPSLKLGTLQRIAISGLLALPFLGKRARTVLLGVFVIFASYVLLSCSFYAPGAPWEMRWEQGSTFAERVDLALSGRPKAVAISFIGAVSSVLLGMLAGRFLFLEYGNRRLGRFFGAAGAIAIGFALLMGVPALVKLPTFVPLYAKLWTPSFVLLSCGISAVLLGLLCYLVDVRRQQALALPFTILGMNSLAVYFLTELVDIAAGNSALRKLFYNSLLAYLPPATASLLVAGAMLALGFLVAAVLYRRRFVIKL